MSPLHHFLKDSPSRKDSNLVLIEGVQALDLFLSTGGQLLELVLSDKAVVNLPSDLSPTIISTNEINSTIGYKFHAGVLAVGRRPKLIDLNDLPAPILFLNRISGPENVGSLVRLASGFGYKSIVFDSESVNPYSKRCIRVSMGNVFSLKIGTAPSLTTAIDLLSARNIQLFSAEITDQAKSIYEFRACPNNHCLVVGGEGPGVSPALLERSQHFCVPQQPGFSSLNVSHAAAIIMSYLFYNSR
jgi:RNA methyltransferase, TrmH family